MRRFLPGDWPLAIISTFGVTITILAAVLWVYLITSSVVSARH